MNVSGFSAFLRRAGVRLRATKSRLPLVLIAGATLAALTLAIWTLPQILTITDKPLTGKELLEARNSVRVTLLQAIGGAILAIGLYFTASTLKLNREGHITERYAKAIELLGNDATDVRIGGIFSLERLARDSASDQQTIMAVLTAYITNRTRQESIPFPKPSDQPITADIQAALTVLGRSADKHDRRIDLTGCGLSLARFYDGTWPGLILNYSILDQAGFSDCDLTNSDISFSRVSATGFLRIKGSGMHFVRSHVQGWFCGADLRQADFSFADLSGCDFGERRTSSGRLIEKAANLKGANFSLAKLDGTIFDGCDLRESKGISRSEFAKASKSDTTLLPNAWADDREEIGPHADVPRDFHDDDN